MGWSYASVLVGAEASQIAAEVANLGTYLSVEPVAPGRAAVATPGEFFDDADEVAQHISSLAPLGAIAFYVCDSDYITATLYRDAKQIHRYVSEIAMTGTPVEEADGVFRIEIDGTSYAEDSPDYPQGPRGADPGWLAPFGTGEIDTLRLAALLEGVPEPGVATSGRLGRPRWLYAEQQHHAILDALHLDPRPLAGQLDEQ